MQQRLPEIKDLDLEFLATNLQDEFLRLVANCLRDRSNGIEYRMDYGRSLLRMRTFLNKHCNEAASYHFDRVCDCFEITPDEARRRISMTMTWDDIRRFQEQNGYGDKMPALEAHIEALFTVEFKDRGLVWHEITTEAKDRYYALTAKSIRLFIENRKAIEVGSAISFDDDIPSSGQDEVSKEDVPPGTKDAKATEVSPGEGPSFTPPQAILDAAKRVSELCGGDNEERRAQWLVAVSDRFKIKFEDLAQWSAMSDDEVVKVGRLIQGNLHKGLRDAMRIVRRIIDDRTPLSTLKNEAIANGGKWEMVDHEFKITIIHLQ